MQAFYSLTLLIMGYQIKSFLYFNKQERRGMTVLIFILLIVIGYSVRMNYLSEVSSENYHEFVNELDSFFADSNIEISEAEKKTHGTKGLLVLEEPFDPNTADLSTLTEAGIPVMCATNIIKYRSGGGKFRNVSDLRKIYGMNDSLYQAISAFIKIENQHSASYERDETNTQKITGPVDLNRADSAELLNLPGIGPVFASRICKYRNRLGGFHSCFQLLEVYGMDSARLNQIKQYLLIDTNLLRKINPDSVTFKELLKHPYFNYQQVKIIFDLKRKSFEPLTLERIKKSGVFPDSVFQQWKYYLSDQRLSGGKN